MTNQTSEATPDGLDEAAVRDALSALDEHLEAVQTFATMAPVGDHGDTRWGEGYKRASEHEINALAPIVETLRTDIPLLLAALDEARGERDIARHAAEAWQVAHDEAETRAEAAEARAAAADRVIQQVRKIHTPIPIYPGDCQSPDGDHGFDPAEEFCRDCPPEFDACGECRDEDGSWIEWPCETALEVDPNRWVDDLARAALGPAVPATEGGCGCPDSRDCCERDADLTPIDGGFATEGEA